MISYRAVLSLLIPCRHSSRQGETPTANTPAASKYGYRSRTGQVVIAGDVQDAVIGITHEIVRRTIRHEHDEISSATSHALVKVNGSDADTEAIWYCRRCYGDAAKGLESDIGGQVNGADLHSSGRRDHSAGRGQVVPAEHLYALSGRPTQRPVLPCASSLRNFLRCAS